MTSSIPKWIIGGVTVLALSAGFVNAVSLIGFTSSAASHITGTVAHGAVSLASGDGSDFIKTAWIVAAFFSGAVLSGVIVKSEALKMGRRYGVALMIESFLLFLATLFYARHNFTGELLASASCGLQNAMIATYSGSVIRTTHLTGIVSDIGAAVGNFLSGGSSRILKQIRLQLAIWAAFFTGSIFGALAYQSWSYHALLLPAATIFILGLTYMKFIRVKSPPSL